MTNEEKVRDIIELSDTKYVYDIVDFSSLETALSDDLMQMAKWKDEQFAKRYKEKMEKIRTLVNRALCCEGNLKCLDDLRDALNE